MLTRAFVETAEYRALIETQDFNFVVGRRGTGKSALFDRVTEHFRSHGKVFLYSARPQEHEALALQQAFSPYASGYAEMRALSRLVWKVHLLLLVAESLVKHYKAERSEQYIFLCEFLAEHKRLVSNADGTRCAEIIRTVAVDQIQGSDLLGVLATHFQVARLQRAVQATLHALNRSAIILYDGLDEGWSPDAPSTAVVGGLALAVADFADASTGIHGTLFIRDNMFRALAHLDNDFSRHIEGNTLRLHWDEETLFQLVGRRLRIALNLESIENNVRIWNRFVDHSLQGREGFVKCLHLTLYRPRDILVLLNRAYVEAMRHQREHVSANDIDSTATSISHDRLQDLVKEYQAVLPGLRMFVELFQGAPATRPISEVLALAENAVQLSQYDELAQSDFAVFGSGKQIVHALFGVGFIGFEDKTLEGRYAFSHDGSGMRIETIGEESYCMVHPSYWRALEIEPTTSATQVSIELSDDYKPLDPSQVKDIRTRRLGQVMSELPNLSEGAADAAKFEDWVAQAVKILFAGRLSNPELKPNTDAIQRRDLVATNTAATGFWRRILEDYESRQIIFEIKNYASLKNDDFRQVLSYTTGEYGRFAVIVYRSENEWPSEVEQGWIRELYHTHNRLIMPLPATVLARCLSKLRNADRFDYTESTLGKRADMIVRSYLSLRHTAVFNRPKRPRSGKRKRR
jgi:hypothetical protein